MLMIAKRPRTYAGRMLEVGEEFEIDDRYVLLVEAQGWAERKGEYQTRDMEAVRRGRGRPRKALN
jgi:hypothetical protein